MERFVFLLRVWMSAGAAPTISEPLFVGTAAEFETFRLTEWKSELDDFQHKVNTRKCPKIEVIPIPVTPTGYVQMPRRTKIEPTLLLIAPGT